jgi:hypothetical protein
VEVVEKDAKPAIGKHTHQNIADSEVLNEVSQIVLKIDFVFVIGTTRF